MCWHDLKIDLWVDLVVMIIFLGVFLMVLVFLGALDDKGYFLDQIYDLEIVLDDRIGCR
jgi:hypothetical protein